MDNLRWILLLSGILLIIGIFTWEVFRRRHSEWDDPGEGADQSFKTDGDGLFAEPLPNSQAQPGDVVGGAHSVPARGDIEVGESSIPAKASAAIATDMDERAEMGHPVSSSETVETSRVGEPLICAIAVSAKPGHRFSGGRLFEALDAVGLRYGPMGIFHHYGPNENPRSQPVFSVANMLEPGSFDLESIDTLYTPGLMLFMQLPGDMDGTEAFDLMLATGRQLAERLGGELRDETRSSLTPQSISHIRERIVDFGRKRLLASH